MKLFQFISFIVLFAITNPNDNLIKKAIKKYNRKDYNESIHLIDNYLNDFNSSEKLKRIEAAYYKSKCLEKLGLDSQEVETRMSLIVAIENLMFSYMESKAQSYKSIQDFQDITQQLVFLDSTLKECNERILEIKQEQLNPTKNKFSIAMIKIPKNWKYYQIEGVHLHSKKRVSLKIFQPKVEIYPNEENREENVILP